MTATNGQANGQQPRLAGAELVTFRLGSRTYALPLTGVREIVRLPGSAGLSVLPAMRPPLAGVLDLRGFPLPVFDVREPAGQAGDVLVLAALGDDGPVGVVVDRVLEVGPPTLRPADGGVSSALPPYVVDVLTDGTGQVFLVDLRAMCTLAAPAAAGAAGQT